MLEMEGSFAAMSITKASDEDVLSIVDTRHIHVGNRIYAIIGFPQLLLSLGRKSVPQRLRHGSFVSAHGTVAQMRLHVMLLVFDPQATTALKNEITIVNLGDQVLSAASISKTTLVI